LAALAFGFSSDAAREASYRSEHYHGGYGFMLEYDIQLYFRRIKAWALQNGDRAKELERIADLLWGPVGSRPAA
jgi:alkylation response protein AidB-like acyl-CoA dehydrogenase